MKAPHVNHDRLIYLSNMSAWTWQALIFAELLKLQIIFPVGQFVLCRDPLKDVSLMMIIKKRRSHDDSSFSARIKFTGLHNTCSYPSMSPPHVPS